MILFSRGPGWMFSWCPWQIRGRNRYWHSWPWPLRSCGWYPLQTAGWSLHTRHQCHRYWCHLWGTSCMHQPQCVATFTWRKCSCLHLTVTFPIQASQLLPYNKVFSVQIVIQALLNTQSRERSWSMNWKGWKIRYGEFVFSDI